MSDFDFGDVTDFDGTTATVGSTITGDFDDGFEGDMKVFFDKDAEGMCGQADAEEIRSVFDECAARYRFREGGYYALMTETNLCTGERTVSMVLGHPRVNDEATATVALCCDIASDCATVRKDMEKSILFAREGWVEELEAEMAGGAPCR